MTLICHIFIAEITAKKLNRIQDGQVNVFPRELGWGINFWKLFRRTMRMPVFLQSF
jgi:hypothetical protein